MHTTEKFDGPHFRTNAQRVGPNTTRETNCDTADRARETQLKPIHDCRKTSTGSGSLLQWRRRSRIKDAEEGGGSGGGRNRGSGGGRCLRSARGSTALERGRHSNARGKATGHRNLARLEDAPCRNRTAALRCQGRRLPDYSVSAGGRSWAAAPGPLPLPTRDGAAQGCCSLERGAAPKILQLGILQLIRSSFTRPPPYRRHE